MTMKELRDKIHKEIDELYKRYYALPEIEYLERATILGRINGLLTACILSYGD